MNKLIIGLLVIAAGAGAYFLLNKKKSKPVIAELKKEWIIGKWNDATVNPDDSGATKAVFDFQQDGNLIRSLGDPVKADTAHYEWSKKNELVWKEKATDSVGKNFSVLKLTKDSLELRSVDSISLVFTRIAK